MAANYIQSSGLAEELHKPGVSGVIKITAGCDVESHRPEDKPGSAFAVIHVTL
jgi:hypothetical protein